MNSNAIPTFTHLREVIEEYVRTRDNPFFLSSNSSANSSPAAAASHSNSKSEKKVAFSINSISDQGVKSPSSNVSHSAANHSSNNSSQKAFSQDSKCLMCKGNHYLNECKQFLALSVVERQS